MAVEPPQEPEPEKPVKKTPIYHVVKMGATADDFTIVKRNVPALSHEVAIDSYVESLPQEERFGEFGAFTARNFKVFPYSLRNVPETVRGEQLADDYERSAPAPEAG